MWKRLLVLCSTLVFQGNATSYSLHRWRSPRHRQHNRDDEWQHHVQRIASLAAERAVEELMDEDSPQVAAIDGAAATDSATAPNSASAPDISAPDNSSVATASAEVVPNDAAPNDPAAATDATSADATSADATSADATSADATSADATPADVSEAFPHVHPEVSKALSDTDGKVSDLNGKGKTAKESMEVLTKARKQATAHLTDGVALQHTMARLQASIRAQDEKLQGLQAQEGRFRREHDVHYARLRSMMDPQIFTIKERLHRHLRSLAKKQQELKSWDEAVKKYKTVALETLRERHHLLKLYKQTEEALAKAKNDVDVADKNYQEEKKLASQNVGAYKFAEAKFRASEEKEKVMEERTSREKMSLKKLRIVFKAQKRQIEDSLAVAHGELQKRLRKGHLIREEAIKELQHAQERYTAWKQEQHTLAQNTAVKKQQYETASKAYAEERGQVIHQAEHKAGSQATSDSDWAWDDWAWGGDSHDPNREAEEVHLAS